jgi:hypothetical protein
MKSLKKEPITNSFFEILDESGNRSETQMSGDDISEWFGYNNGAKFVPIDESNQYVGRTDRTGSLNHPDGIQDNDFISISLNNGECTRLRRVNRSIIEVPNFKPGGKGKLKCRHYSYWSIPDSVDTDKPDWDRDPNAICVGFCGMEITKPDDNKANYL